MFPQYLVMKGVGKVLAPFIALNVNDKWDVINLSFRSFFQTPDSKMNGDDGDDDFYMKMKDRSVWWVATRWQWRNTSHGYNTFKLGIDDTDVKKVWQSGEGKLEKYFKAAYENEKIIGFELKVAFKYPFINKRITGRFGWKLQWDERFPAQYVFSIRPIQSL